MVSWKTLVFAFVLALFALPAAAQDSPIPWLQPQWLDSNGKPVVNGCLGTYVSGTTTPQATYADAGGVTPNSNPVQLDSAGRAFVFLTSSSYTFKLYAAGTSGGCTSSVGAQIWSIDGITSSVLALLASNNTWTGINTYNASTVFNGAVTFNAGFTSTGPNNMSGGGTLAGTYTGSPTFSGTPNFSNGFTSTTGTFSGAITSTVATTGSTPPFVVASTDLVANLNAASVNGCTFAIPCPLGSGTPNTVAATTITSTGNITDGAMSANSGLCAQYGAAGVFGAAALKCGGPAVQALTTKPLGSNVGLSPSTLTTIDSQSVTMPATGCPCRVQISYSYFWSFNSGSNSVVVDFYVSDGTTNYANSENGTVSASSGSGGNSAVQTTSTYANGANVTFTVKAESPQNMTVNKNGFVITSMQSYLELMVEQSN